MIEEEFTQYVSYDNNLVYYGKPIYEDLCEAILQEEPIGNPDDTDRDNDTPVSFSASITCKALNTPCQFKEENHCKGFNNLYETEDILLRKKY